MWRLSMKKCDICKQELSLELFGKNRRNKNGLHTTCKSCKKILDKKYRENNVFKVKNTKHLHYLKNKDHVIKRVNDYISNNRIKHNEWATIARQRLKSEVFSYYGKGQIKCNCCEEKELHLLTIDHINGGGNKHREQEGIKTGYSTYSWLKKNNFPEEFQVLCWNCQYIKRQEEVSPKNPTKRQLQCKEIKRSLKLECLSHYGDICFCGEDNLTLLTLDHVNDDGAEHRRNINQNFYTYLRQNNFPNDPPLQVLCIKCQYRKMYDENGKRKKRPTIDHKDATIIV